MDGSYLVLRRLHSWLVLSEDHGQGKEKHEQSVTHIAKHHGKEKGECDDGVRSCRQTGRRQAASRGGLPQKPPGTSQENVRRGPLGTFQSLQLSIYAPQGSLFKFPAPISPFVKQRSQCHLTWLL